MHLHLSSAWDTILSLLITVALIINIISNSDFDSFEKFKILNRWVSAFGLLLRFHYSEKSKKSLTVTKSQVWIYSQISFCFD